MRYCYDSLSMPHCHDSPACTAAMTAKRATSVIIGFVSRVWFSTLKVDEHTIVVLVKKHSLLTKEQLNSRLGFEPELNQSMFRCLAFVCQKITAAFSTQNQFETVLHIFDLMTFLQITSVRLEKVQVTFV
jgi:hypothetical protein